MKIENNAFVSMEYALSLDSGEIMDQTEPGEALSFICSGGQIIPGLEKQLLGMETGQTAKIVVEADEGYGRSRPDLVTQIPRSHFPTDTNLQSGESFEAHGPHGPVRFKILSATQETVTADFNHPLAGQRLHFDVKITEVRPASAEELQALEDDNCSPSDCSCCGGGCEH